MGDILNNNLAIVESRCSLDPEGQAAFKFLAEWIDVSLEMGLDPMFRREVELRLDQHEQEVLFQ